MNDIFTFVMTQFLKDHIREAIIEGALHEFAMHGFRGASMSDIAERSGISTGNLYRYFENKATLFDAVVPPSFVNALLKKIRERFDAYPIGSPPKDALMDPIYFQLSEEVLDFTIAHRLRVLIVFEGSAGTAYQSVTAELQKDWTKKVIEKLKLRQIAENPEVVFLLVEGIYGNFFRLLGSILRRFSAEVDIRTAVRNLTDYHLGGLNMLAK